MKKLSILGIIVLLAFFIVSCDNKSKTLIVTLKDSKEQKTTEAFSRETIERAFNSGGAVDVTIENLREIDPQFDTKYAISNNEGNFKTYGALVNFLNDRGWKYHELNLGMLVMIK